VFKNFQFWCEGIAYVPLMPNLAKSSFLQKIQASRNAWEKYKARFLKTLR